MRKCRCSWQRWKTPEAIIIDGDWYTVVPGLLGVETNNRMLVGGLCGSQSVGLFRLARHLGEGYKRGDNIVTIIRRVDILPVVDMAGSDTAKLGTCSN